MHYRVIAAEVEMTHSNKLVHDTVFVYSQTIAYLVRNAKDASKVTKAFNHAESLCNSLAKAQYRDDSV